MILRYINYIKSKRIILTVVLLAIVFSWRVLVVENNSKLLRVDFFDIGQGDAIFIEEPGGGQILIDGGPDSVILEKLGKKMNYFDRYIDVVIATHPDKDHISGLIDVLKYYEIGELWMTDFGKDTSFYKELMSIIESENITARIIGRNDYFELGDTQILILNPADNMLSKNIDINDTSIVARVSYGDVSFLFTGDITQKTEKEIMEHLDNPAFLDSDILKAGHHGSKSSSSEEFLKIVSPEAAVIQAGKDNPYHHPHISVLNLLDSLGVEILRNDIYGDIGIISDGKKYTIEF
jgi:competence protein ComEC